MNQYLWSNTPLEYSSYCTVNLYGFTPLLDNLDSLTFHICCNIASHNHSINVIPEYSALRLRTLPFRSDNLSGSVLISLWQYHPNLNRLLIGSLMKWKFPSSSVIISYLQNVMPSGPSLISYVISSPSHDETIATNYKNSGSSLATTPSSPSQM